MAAGSPNAPKNFDTPLSKHANRSLGKAAAYSEDEGEKSFLRMTMSEQTQHHLHKHHHSPPTGRHRLELQLPGLFLNMETILCIGDCTRKRSSQTISLAESPIFDIKSCISR